MARAEEIQQQEFATATSRPTEGLNVFYKIGQLKELRTRIAGEINQANGERLIAHNILTTLNGNNDINALLIIDPKSRKNIIILPDFQNGLSKRQEKQFTKLSTNIRDELNGLGLQLTHSQQERDALYQRFLAQEREATVQQPTTLPRRKPETPAVAENLTAVRAQLSGETAREISASRALQLSHQESDLQQNGNRDTRTNFDRANEILNVLENAGIDHIDITPAELARKIERIAVDMRVPNMRPSEFIGTVLGRAAGFVGKLITNLNIPVASPLARKLAEAAAKVAIHEEVFERFHRQSETHRTTLGEGVKDLALNFVGKRIIPGVSDIGDAGVNTFNALRPKVDFKGERHYNGGAVFYLLKLLGSLFPIVSSDDVSGFIEGYARTALNDPSMLAELQDAAAVIAAEQIKINN